MPPVKRSPRYRALQSIVGIALKTAADFDVSGGDNYPSTGPYIVAFNHLHWLDLPVAFVTLRHRVTALALHELADRPAIAYVARRVGNAIYVQKETDHRAMKQALRVLRSGGALLVAPEGGRSPMGALRDGQPGTAYLASRSGAPVVPLAAWGHERLADDLRRFRRGKIRVRIGEPLVLDGTPNRAKGDRLDSYTSQIMHSLAALLPKRYRGVYE
jgi:1-acyl-sn-glycerol-3-phosphate acyltransferase